MSCGSENVLAFRVVYTSLLASVQEEERASHFPFFVFSKRVFKVFVMDLIQTPSVAIGRLKSVCKVGLELVQ